MAANILIVDDEPGSIQVIARMLSGMGNLRFATHGKAALMMARESPPDLMLLDAEMPGITGFEVCEQMRDDPVLRSVPVIFVTSHSDTAFEVAGLELGAADFIAKPVSEPLLVARVRTQLRIKQLNDELRQFATVDALTEVANRRCFDESLQREWRNGLRAGLPTALLIMDVDHFKLFNDLYGHPAGDSCLRQIARALSTCVLRPADLVARIGGEEFALLLPNTPLVGAQYVAQKVLQSVQGLCITHDRSPTAGYVTVSIGMAHYDESSPAWTVQGSSSGFGHDCQNWWSGQELVMAADRALYCAKKAGRAQAWRLDVAEAGAAHQASRVHTLRSASTTTTTTITAATTP